MKVGDIVKSNLPYPRVWQHGVVLNIKPLTGGKTSAEVYWDDGHIRGTMAKYLEIICG